MNRYPRERADWLVSQVCGGPLPTLERATTRRWLERAAAALGIIEADPADRFANHAFGYQASTLIAAIEDTAHRLLGEQIAFGRWRPLVGGSTLGLPSLRAGLLEPVRDVNAARLDQLANLPGLGKVSAGRIVAQRSVKPFTDLAEVRRAGRVSLPAWERAESWLSVDPVVTARSRPEPLPVVRMAELGRQGRGPLVGARGQAPGAARRAAFVLCCRELMRSPLVPQLFAPDPARLRANTRAISRHRQSAGHQADKVALVPDRSYIEFLPELLGSARENIRIAMFVLDGASSEVQALIEQLTAARARGVTVRLIIGDDLPGDRHGAATTNEKALALLRSTGLATRTHWPEMALHEKSVVVDDRWSLVGSHNWTPRSFFGAGETSLCVDSPALAADLRARLDNLWRAIDTASSRRRVSTRLLDQLAPGTQKRLIDLGLSRPAQLTTDAKEQRRLAREAGLPVAALRTAATTAHLMEGLRVCEATAALLLAAGLTSAAAVRAAKPDTVRSALEAPLTTPSRLAGRRVNPDVADLLVEGARHA